MLEKNNFYKEKIDLCFIILNYKQYELTKNAARKCLNFEKDLKIRIIIIDNNSEDNSYEKLCNVFSENKKIKIFKSVKNSGYAVGNNLGIKKAIELFNTKYIAIMNPDVELDDKTDFVTILEKFAVDDNIAIATGIMLNSKNEIDLNSFAWKLPDKFDDFFLNIYFLSKFFNPLKYENLKLEKNNFIYVDVVPGSFFIAKMSYFLEIGLFDEETFLYCEERIISYKIKNKGLKEIIVPNFFFKHNHDQQKITFRKSLSSYSSLIRSRLFFNLKYNSLSKFFVLPVFYISVLIGYISLFLIKSVLLIRGLLYKYKD